MFHSARCITGASAVCNMPAPYSEDLRWRAIWIRHFCGYSEEETCFHLGISKWTLRRYLHGYFVSGDVKAKKIGRPLGTLHFQLPEELIIMEAILENATVWFYTSLIGAAGYINLVLSYLRMFNT